MWRQLKMHATQGVLVGIERDAALAEIRIEALFREGLATKRACEESALIYQRFRQQQVCTWQ
jgi:hypothetical protein